MWYLIIIIITIKGGAAIQKVEFTSQENCVYARNLLATEITHSTLMCVEK